MPSILLVDDSGLFRGIAEKIERRTRCQLLAADSGGGGRPVGVTPAQFIGAVLPNDLTGAIDPVVNPVAAIGSRATTTIGRRVASFRPAISSRE